MVGWQPLTSADVGSWELIMDLNSVVQGAGHDRSPSYRTTTAVPTSRAVPAMADLFTRAQQRAILPQHVLAVARPRSNPSSPADRVLGPFVISEWIPVTT
jgi:hypothetical protein